jgi:Golgi phosphoprotein 3 (GPP34)
MALGAELVVLAVDAQRGTVRTPIQLGFALAAAELVDLACARRVEAADGRIHVVERLRTGDPVLDDTLARLAEEPKGPAIDDWIALRAADRVPVHLAALLESGELTGRLVRLRLDAAAEPSGLRVADPHRRAALAEKLVHVARHEVELEDDAFGALAYAAGLPAHVLSGMAKHRTVERLKELAAWFTDTSRYLPGCRDKLALGDADVEPGGINPAHDEPWRLLIRLAVEEAVKRAEVVTRREDLARKSMHGKGVSQDVANAALLANLYNNNL